MKNKTIIILTTVFVLSMFASCTKEKAELLNENENKIASFEDYYNFLQEETTAEILITNFGGGSSHFQTTIIGNRKPLQLTADNKSYSYGEWQYYEAQNISHAQIGNADLNFVYGKTFNVIVSGTDFNAKSGTKVDGIYIPELIEVEFANLDNEKVTVGTVITWNVDENNTKGVVALVHYTPLAQTSEAIRGDNPEAIRSGFTFTDSGTYTITAEDLSYFPDNAWIEFEVGRAGFGITTNEDGTEDYSLAAVTSKTFSFQIKK